MASIEDEMIARVLQRTKSVPAATQTQAQGETAPQSRGDRGHPRPEQARARNDEAPRRPRRDRPTEKGQARAPLKAMPGLGAKVRIPTSFGALPVEALRRRDEVRTAQGGFAPVATVDRMTFDSDFLLRHEAVRPVLIRANALGRGIPAVDITVSPEQKLSPARMPTPASFKTAGEMAGLPGVLRAPVGLATYFRFHIGKTAAFQVEGIWVLAEA